MFMAVYAAREKLLLTKGAVLACTIIGGVFGGDPLKLRVSNAPILTKGGIFFTFSFSSTVVLRYLFRDFVPDVFLFVGRGQRRK